MEKRFILKQSLFNKIISTSLALAVGFAPSLSIGASNPVTAENRAKSYAENEEFREITKVIVESVRSAKDVVGTLETAGVSIESIRAIEADLQKRMPESSVLPKLQMTNDELIVDGKKTGIVVLSYSPLKVKFQGRIWSSKPSATGDDNYRSLVKFIEKPKTFSWFSLIIPQAKAFWGTPDPLTGAMSGGVLGVFGGSLVAILMGGEPIKGAFYGAGIGLIFGGLMGLNNQRNGKSSRSESVAQ